MPFPPITALPTPPNRATDTQAEFSNNTDAFLGALNTFQTQVNASGDYIDTELASLDADIAAATAAATASATASAATATAKAGEASASATAAASSATSSAASAAASAASQSVASSAATTALAYPDGQVLAHLNVIKSIERKATELFKFADEDYGFYDAATLTFTKSPVADALDIVRASTATANGPVGLVTYPVDGLRIAYDPVSGERLGARVERSATNLLLHSESFDNAAWSKAASTITANATIAPDGLLTADKIVESATTASHYIDQIASTSTNDVFSCSFYAKAAERTILEIRFADDSLASGSRAYATFDLVAGTTLNGQVSATSVSSSISPVGNGWFLCNVTATLGITTGTTTRCIALLRTSATISSALESYTGDGTSGLFIWGAQLTTTSFPVSYIPTTTAQVTRAADVVYKTPSVLSMTAGTLLFEFIVPAGVDVSRTLMKLGGGADDQDRFEILLSSSYKIESRLFSGNVSLAPNIVSAQTLAAGQTCKVALTFTANGTIRLCVLGGAVQSNPVTGAFTKTNSLLIIGQNRAPVSAVTTVSNAIIKQAHYIPRALTDAELIAWSKP